MRADHDDIAEVLVRYATGIDRLYWGLFRTCFADDVVADYGDAGRWDSAEALTAFMVDAHAGMGHTMHRLSNLAITVDGDRATSRTYVDAVLMAPDVLVRTEQGWRIQRRTFTSVHFQVFD